MCSNKNPCRFAQLAVNVLNVPYSFGNDEKTALEGIAAMEDFFRSIGMPTSISDMEIELTDTQIKRAGTQMQLYGQKNDRRLRHPERCRYGKYLPDGQIKQYKKHKDASAKRQARLFLLRPNAYYLLLNQFPTPAP